MNPKSQLEENGRYCIVFDVQAEPENHISTRLEDNGAEFRRFVVELASPLDKRLFVRAAFSGPSDPNFHNLVEEFRNGLHAADEEQDDGSTTDTSSETETETL